MRQIKIFSLLSVLLFAGLLPPAFAAASRPPLPGNCPVMPGSPVKEKFYVDYQGRRVFLCCRSCVRAFKKHPERYASRLSSPA